MTAQELASAVGAPSAEALESALDRLGLDVEDCTAGSKDLADLKGMFALKSSGLAVAAPKGTAAIATKVKGKSRRATPLKTTSLDTANQQEATGKSVIDTAMQTVKTSSAVELMDLDENLHSFEDKVSDGMAARILATPSNIDQMTAEKVAEGLAQLPARSFRVKNALAGGDDEVNDILASFGVA